MEQCGGSEVEASESGFALPSNTRSEWMRWEGLAAGEISDLFQKLWRVQDRELGKTSIDVLEVCPSSIAVQGPLEPITPRSVARAGRDRLPCL